MGQEIYQELTTSSAETAMKQEIIEENVDINNGNDKEKTGQTNCTDKYLGPTK